MSSELNRRMFECLNVFNLITGINESKILTKHIPCECKCKFDSSICNSDRKWNNDKCWCECKNPEHNACGKDCIWSLATCSCENGEYLVSTIDNSVTICDEIIKVADCISTIAPTNVTSNVSTNFHNKKARCKMSCYSLHKVLLVIILVIINSCYDLLTLCKTQIKTKKVLIH